MAKMEQIQEKEKMRLRAGDRIYECNHHVAVLTELLTDPAVRIQSDGSRYWHWKARRVDNGDIIEYGISEEAPYYVNLYWEDVYAVGFGKARRVMPPFDTGKEIETKDLRKL